jgi:hypothetical protein
MYNISVTYTYQRVTCILTYDPEGGEALGLDHEPAEERYQHVRQSQDN